MKSQSRPILGMKNSALLSFKVLDWWHLVHIRLPMRGYILHDIESDFLALVLEFAANDVVRVQQLMITRAPKRLQRITQMYISDHLFKTIERVREH